MKHLCWLECAVCHEHVSMPWNGGRNNEKVAKRWRAKGWEFHAYNAASCVCPTCIAKRKERKEREKMAQSNQAQPARADLSLFETKLNGEHVVAASRPTGAGRRVGPALSPTTGYRSEPPAANAVVVAGPRSLTTDEKMKVRNLLDNKFDDKEGRYLEDYSDQRIGAECDVPWASVAAFREFAYGPIREDPRIAGLRQEFADLRARLARAEEQLAELTGGTADAEGSVSTQTAPRSNSS
jgi:hypothetical protein